MSCIFYFSRLAGSNRQRQETVIMNEDKIPLNYYRGQNGHFVKDTKIDQKYVHPTKRKIKG